MIQFSDFEFKQSHLKVLILVHVAARRVRQRGDRRDVDKRIGKQKQINAATVLNAFSSELAVEVGLGVENSLERGYVHYYQGAQREK